tara:strand:- start:9397 stop:10692 length:1296 start_codon:yes stop_codon:yes gene_type:complete
MDKVGISYLSRNSNTVGNTEELGALNDKMVTARVVDISLNSNSQLFNQTGQWGGIGTIQYQLVSTPTSPIVSNQSLSSNLAKPLFPQFKNYPLVNELVILFRLPTTGNSQATGTYNYYYLNSIGIWNHPEQNGIPDVYSTNTTESPSQNKSNDSIELGNIQQPSGTPFQLDLNGNSGGKFIEKGNIRPILSFIGDQIFEGRFSNSLRLGSTSPSQGSVANNWSTTGEIGSPITILRNGQPKDLGEPGWLPVTENINTDLSSIYLTSTQQIPIDVSVASSTTGGGTSVPFSNIIKETPQSPQSYNQQQIILNSGRLIFNTNVDSILMSSQKSIAMESVEGLGIKSLEGNVNLLSPKGIVSLGRQNATESLVLGDAFITQFSSLLENLDILLTALSGEPLIPAAAASSVLIKSSISNIKSQIPNLISKSVKTA